MRAAKFASPQQQQDQSRQRSSFANLARDFYKNPYTGDNLNRGQREGGLVPTVLRRWFAEEAIELKLKGIFHDRVICFNDNVVAEFESDMILPPKPGADATAEQKDAFEKSKEKAVNAQKALSNNAVGKEKRDDAAGQVWHHIMKKSMSENLVKQLTINWMDDPGEHHQHVQQVLQFLEERSNDISAIREDLNSMLTHGFTVARTPEEVMLNLGKLLEINVIEQDKLMKKNPANPDEMINKDDSYPATPEKVLLRTFEKFIADPCEAVKTLRAVVSTAINKKKSLEWTTEHLKQIIQNYRPSAIQQPQPLPIRAHAATTFEDVNDYKSQGLSDTSGVMEEFDQGYNVSFFNQQHNNEFNRYDMGEPDMIGGDLQHMGDQDTSVQAFMGVGQRRPYPTNNQQQSQPFQQRQRTMYQPPLPSNPPPSALQPCTWFQSGHCMYGNNCRFGHQLPGTTSSSMQVNVNPQQWQQFQHYNMTQQQRAMEANQHQARGTAGAMAPSGSYMQQRPPFPRK